MQDTDPPSPYTPPQSPEVRTKSLTPVGLVVIPIVILGLGFVVFNTLKGMAVRPPEEAPKPIIPVVETALVKFSDAEVEVASQGILESSAETRAASEVGGKLTWVSEKFVAGGEFNLNEELLKIESVDYEALVAQARARLAEADMALKVEAARGEQAMRDWKKLGNGENPDSDLVTRGPQLAAATAAHQAAVALLAKAEKDLKRTTLVAPYKGRIRRTYVEAGSFVPIGSPLADFYSTETFEIRLPMSVDEYTLLDHSAQPKVKLTTTAGAQTLEYEGKIVRTEGELDRLSRSMHGVAEVKSGENPDPLLAPGLFFKASISGRNMKNVATLPRQCLYGDSSVLVVTEKNEIFYRTVKIDRRQSGSVFISEGLKEGERVCITALAVVTDGMIVEPVESKPTPAGEAQTSAHNL